MKFSIMSDLHLEFENQKTPVLDLPGGDVLLLAGDILLANHFTFNNTKTDNYHRFAKTNFHKYDLVIMILGNHEHYDFDLNDTFDIIQKEFIDIYPNAILLGNELANVGGINIYGGTMWTNMDKSNPHAIMDAKFGMSDFQVISNGVGGNPYKPRKFAFTPEDSVEEHKYFMFGLAKALEEHKDEPFIVMSHHLPSRMSIPSEFKGSSLNPAYASELDDIMYDNDNIKLWVHGHTHNSNDYLIGMTRVICNPRGYYGHSLNKNFDVNLQVEL